MSDHESDERKLWEQAAWEQAAQAARARRAVAAEPSPAFAAEPSPFAQFCIGAIRKMVEHEMRRLFDPEYLVPVASPHRAYELWRQAMIPKPWEELDEATRHAWVEALECRTSLEEAWAIACPWKSVPPAKDAFTLAFNSLPKQHHDF